MSVLLTVMKRNGAPITAEDLAAAVRHAPHFEWDGDSVVTLTPVSRHCPVVMLELLEDGTLYSQLPSFSSADGDEILATVRRFASCIPGAVIEVEGELIDPI